MGFFFFFAWRKMKGKSNLYALIYLLFPSLFIHLFKTKLLSPTILCCIIVNKDSSVLFIFVLLYIICNIPLIALKIFFLSSNFINFILMYFGMVFFGFILFVDCGTPWICRLLVFIKFVRFSNIISSFFFCLLQPLLRIQLRIH